MRILVIGASGYIGSRAIPALLKAGHSIIAGVRDADGLSRFAWADDVVAAEVDVTEPATLDRALAHDVEAILYLVHGMGGDNFRETDRRAAQATRDLANVHGVSRIVYVSGIIPNIPRSELSEHLNSRLEVEELLSEAKATVVTLRAAMIVGASSTSFELMAQLAQRLPVTVVPDWMQTNVEPIAVVDVVAAIVGAVAFEGKTTHFDVGGGEVLPYPELIERYTNAAGLTRPQLSVPFLPEPMVAKLASWIADVPSSTVTALMESLREDMVAAEHEWIGQLIRQDYSPFSVDESLKRALSSAESAAHQDPMTKLPGDPDWANAVEDAEADVA